MKPENIKAEITCPECGSSNKAIRNTCRICFSRLHYETAAARPLPANTPPASRIMRFNKILFMVIVLLILLIAYRTGIFPF